jgi:ABC-type amino acid transport substrate-binding protein
LKSSKNTGAWLRIQKLTAVLLLLAVAFLLPGVLPRAAAADAVTVRVGYFYNGDFMHVNADGTYSGYDIEYYDTIAGYAGWKIQFVPYSNLQAALRGLKRGDIDIMSGLSKTPQREQDFLVSSNKMCTSRIAVQTRADDDRFTAGDPRTMQNLTCGILKGSNVVALYKNWCAENGLTAHIREYNSLERRNTALFAGEVDAIAAGSSVENAQKIAEFPALDLYFMLNQSRRDLKTVLDRSMGILALEDPTYTSALFEKYFPSTRNSRPSFSAAEKRFIAARPVVRAAVLKDDAPFSLELANGTVEEFCRNTTPISPVSSVFRFSACPMPPRKRRFRPFTTARSIWWENWVMMFSTR